MSSSWETNRPDDPSARSPVATKLSSISLETDPVVSKSASVSGWSMASATGGRGGILCLGNSSSGGCPVVGDLMVVAERVVEGIRLDILFVLGGRREAKGVDIMEKSESVEEVVQ